MTRIKDCTCVHPYQDALYGKGKRVHNDTLKMLPPECRCTVCGKERPR